MLTIRMRRVGAKKQPYFRVVVTEARSARDGRSLEVLGHYNPTAQPETFVLNRPRLRHWLDRGAQPSDTVRTLLSRHPAEPTETTEPIEPTEPTETTEPIEPTEPDDAEGATPVEAGADQAGS